MLVKKTMLFIKIYYQKKKRKERINKITGVLIKEVPFILISNHQDLFWIFVSNAFIFYEINNITKKKIYALLKNILITEKKKIFTKLQSLNYFFSYEI